MSLFWKTYSSDLLLYVQVCRALNEPSGEDWSLAEDLLKEVRVALKRFPTAASVTYVKM